MINKLDFSIPANNQKIIELYNKLKKDELDPNPVYQRKLVWRKQHKFRFIETILSNYPFPEIYLAPGEIDTETLVLKDQIVDGQQRLTTIRNYIEGKDVFGLNNIPIKKFSDLPKNEKEDFLNYEISVRYLKNADESQIREIFQRINSTEYSLNKTERINAQWGDSEFVCFAKQLIEQDLDIDPTLISYKLETANRLQFLDFFHTKYQVFTENDINRMLALQYILTLLATICEGEYFRRNDKVQDYIEKYFEDFVNAGEVEVGLLNTVHFIESLELHEKSYWFNKANIFTLICECYKFNLGSIDKVEFKNKLLGLELDNDIYMMSQVAQQDSLVFEVETPTKEISADFVKYFEYAKEAVNEKSTRDYRGSIVSRFLNESIIEA